jgi:hypothetical protein
MAEFSIQGTLSLTGTVLATGLTPSGVLLTKAFNLRFNNPLAYTVQLYKYDAATLTTTLIYNLSLSAGDTVTDNFTYALNPGDQLKAFSNIVGTTYYAYGITY